MILLSANFWLFRLNNGPNSEIPLFKPIPTPASALVVPSPTLVVPYVAYIDFPFWALEAPFFGLWRAPGKPELFFHLAMIEFEGERRKYHNNNIKDFRVDVQKLRSPQK